MSLCKQISVIVHALLLLKTINSNMLNINVKTMARYSRSFSKDHTHHHHPFFFPQSPSIFKQYKDIEKSNLKS